MALKIRLRQQGRHNHQVYRLVVTDAGRPRDGKYIEMLGWYDPNREQDNVHIIQERVSHWLANGAILTEKAESLIKRVAPGALTEWKQKVAARKAKVCAKRRAARKKQETVTV